MKTDYSTQEFDFQWKALSGLMMLLVQVVILPVIGALPFLFFEENVAWGCFVPVIIFFLICMFGFMIIEPNEVRVVLFFGEYMGTFKKVGFYWINPFMTTRKLSYRLRNMEIKPIKVNDKIGNPVMIGMVLVWRVKDTYKAVFDVDSGTLPAEGMSNSKVLEKFVSIQCDAALREVTGHYAYDESRNTSVEELTLRSGGTEINHTLEDKINERLNMAGMEVVEARLNYIAYAPEIAAVMLRRQQAEAIISAREKIVEGAVSMVKMALDGLSNEGIEILDDSQKASMVSNLLVVLCADEPAQPIVNTGS